MTAVASYGALGRGDDADEVTVEAGLTCLPGTSEPDMNCVAEARSQQGKPHTKFRLPGAA
ncbi:hypothetical protein HPB50_003308 [Hyalomma asiaticum]|uniref:Uncharacterized protein n=1 Tax=Hyalomma asiaticum TaxID=266040 RepID=A0ACB7SHM1_HYAAI|nr:hypothetical protein HPB50_003308 [Hyalomma asiaticum]